jgi:DNA-binding NarL/FixJ family response regulator
LTTYRETAAPDAEAARRLAALTAREIDVLELVAQGATNGEIAAALIIGDVTVKTHIGHIFTKLGVRDRAGAIVFAFDHGVVVPRA